MNLSRALAVTGSILSLLISILIGLGAWNLNATRSALETLARMEERQVAADARTSDLRVRLADVETRIQAIEIRLAEGRRTTP